jgi:hypothetical protein
VVLLVRVWFRFHQIETDSLSLAGVTVEPIKSKFRPSPVLEDRSKYSLIDNLIADEDGCMNIKLKRAIQFRSGRGEDRITEAQPPRRYLDTLELQGNEKRLQAPIGCALYLYHSYQETFAITSTISVEGTDLLISAVNHEERSSRIGFWTRIMKPFRIPPERTETSGMQSEGSSWRVDPGKAGNGQ